MMRHTGWVRAVYWSSVLMVLVGCVQEAVTETEAAAERGPLAEYLEKVMADHGVPAMAVAVLRDGDLVHESYHGKASLESGEPLGEEALFKVFSLTKTFIATSVFRLIEEGELGLEDSLADHFEGLPETWQGVTIANLLSHSSGLPDVRAFGDELSDDSVSNRRFIELLFGEERDFATGEQWSYNQTNYILLRMLIEKITGRNFSDYVLDHQFPASDSSHVVFSADPFAESPERVAYYQFDREANEYERKNEFSGDKNLPLAGMSLTLGEYIRWSQRLRAGELVDPATLKAMWTPFQFTASDRNFLHGWDVYDVNGHESYGFSGGGVSGFRIFPGQDLTVIVLMTGYQNYSLQDIVIEHLAGLLEASLRDEEAALTEEIMSESFLSGSASSPAEIYAAARAKHPGEVLQSVFTDIAFTLFFQMDRRDEAIRLFETIVVEHPESADAHGSLGYMHLLSDNLELARENYLMAEKIDPDNGFSRRRIAQIDEAMRAVGPPD